MGVEYALVSADSASSELFLFDVLEFKHIFYDIQ
jgi:hypothetical protein